jgi:hypothetical protein
MWVFGSRFYGRPHRSLYFHHYLGNRLISLLFNILFNQTPTDIETCYKMMTIQVARSLRLSANDFGIEVELSAEIVRQRNLRIYELGISCIGRTYAEGKKMNWKDGVRGAMVRFKISLKVSEHATKGRKGVSVLCLREWRAWVPGHYASAWLTRWTRRVLPV